LPLHNDPDGEYCRFEAEGLHITVPKGIIHGEGGVGVRALVGLRGDFEVTATIELLNVDRPPSGTGAGVGLYLPTTGASATFIGRLLGPRGRQFILCSIQNGTQWKQHWTDCSASLLRLRMQRIGTMIIYSFAPGMTGGDFHELHRAELNAADIRLSRFTAVNNKTPCAVDVRLIDLRLRAGPPIGDATIAAPARPRRWLFASAVLMLAFTGVLGALLYRRRFRAAEQPSGRSRHIE
jgi:hypothetical protein